MSEWRIYERSSYVELRPYIPGECLEYIKVIDREEPKLGGMIARNIADEDDQWYVSEKDYNENYCGIC